MEISRKLEALARRTARLKFEITELTNELETLARLAADLESELPKQEIGDDSPIESLGLSVRAFNPLKRAGIKTVGELRKLTDNELLDLRSFSLKNLREVRQALQQIS